jgi:hypothetical protein
VSTSSVFKRCYINKFTSTATVIWHQMDRDDDYILRSSGNEAVLIMVFVWIDWGRP